MAKLRVSGLNRLEVLCWPELPLLEVCGNHFPERYIAYLNGQVVFKGWSQFPEGLGMVIDCLLDMVVDCIPRTEEHPILLLTTSRYAYKEAGLLAHQINLQLDNLAMVSHHVRPFGITSKDVILKMGEAGRWIREEVLRPLDLVPGGPRPK